MLEQITIGQYIKGDSAIHRLDPRTKLLFVFFYVMVIFLVNNWSTNLFMIAISLLIAWMSQVPGGYLLRGLKPILWIVLLTALLHILMTHEGEILFAWGWLQIYEKGVIQAVAISIRLILLMLIASLLTLTTSPMDLTDGMENLLRPFARLGLPAHELALMMSIALRFIPTLLEETEKIVKAQTSRGVNFQSGSLLKRAKSMVPILIPLFLSAFRRADELSLAMEARCYHGGAGRTRRKQMHFSRLDGLALLFALLLLLGLMLLRRWG
ncbi:energy-coupling factor transporter transmembrane component T family protein [Rubeoparvulum massiliense]|uniref:energy-coupling factor transporter transmembrane component T family protein n=1 Tax=Rubeoparvulum massiliense TaxID=1631346 RepID=UPI00065DE2C2|nr:energy-coupling factor transporter transmembrane component T [Rubeoparvulum massiliense]